ncbi:MAG: sucrase ferredoxin [Actinomycetota bacterium]
MTGAGRCSLTSEARGEPMVGTASTVRSWLLLEDPGPWGRDALRDARLPERIGLELRRRCRAAGVRPLLIRRPAATPPTPRAGVRCFAIRSGPESPWIEGARLGAVADALNLDLVGLGRGVRPGLTPHGSPVFLVCTHGRRDPCCAERGRPLARALGAAFPDETWEGSHIGGDRFAGNLLAFPYGLYLGRVRPDEGADVARTYAAGRVPLEHLRGRSCYPMAVQAAEHTLRAREDLAGLDDLALERTEEREGGSTATFRTPRGRFAVSVVVEASAPAHLTCRSRAEEPAPAYRVTGVERLADPDGS